MANTQEGQPDYSKFAAPEGALGLQDPETNPVDPVIPPTSEEPPAFQPNPVWNILTETLGIDIPENLTAETEPEVIKTTLSQFKPQQAPVLHPVAAELNEKLTNPEFKFDDWIKEMNSKQNLSSLSGREFMQPYLKTQYPDASEEDINEIIESLERSGTLKLQELEGKKHLKAIEQQEKANFVIKQKEAQTLAIVEENKRVEKELQGVFAEAKNLNEIYGVPISEAEKESYNRTFAELTRMDENGQVPLLNLLQSNMDLYKFVYVVLNGDQKIKEAIFDAKEGTKGEVWKKLKIQPTSGPGKPAGPQGSGKPNYKSWTQPES